LFFYNIHLSKMHNIFKTIPELVKVLQILLKLRCHSVGLTCVGTNECIPLKLKEKKNSLIQ